MINETIDALKYDIRRLDQELEAVKVRQSSIMQNICALQMEHYRNNKGELKL